MACEGLDTLEVAETWRSFFDWVKARPKDFTVTDPLWANAWDARGKWDPSARSYNHDLRDGAPSTTYGIRATQTSAGLPLRLRFTLVARVAP